MESTTVINDLRVKVNNRQILSIALPITLAILIPQVNMLINSIFLGRLSKEALGNAGIIRLLARDEGFELVGWADDLHVAERALDETSDKT